MIKKDISTKKIIALAVIMTICALAVIQGFVEKKIPAEFMTLGGTVIGYYFGYGKGQADGKDSE